MSDLSNEYHKSDTMEYTASDNNTLSNGTDSHQTDAAINIPLSTKQQQGNISQNK